MPWKSKWAVLILPNLVFILYLALGFKKEILNNLCVYFFQLIDDVLDFTSCADHLGKPTAADLKLGLATGPVLFACRQVSQQESVSSK